MEEELFHLSYVSTANDFLKLIDFENILNAAKEKNNLLNITGILIYCNKSFFQILEGPKENVLDVFEQIKNDCRHDNIIKIQEEHIVKRKFKDWNMAFKSFNKELSALDYFNNEQFYNHTKDFSTANYNQTSLKVLNDFFDLNG